MKGSFKIIRDNQYKLSKWSGGTTKQLYIYPQTGDYATRTFTYRLSIATTQTETSTFTKLQQTSRVLSILQGKLSINHKEHHSATLLPYEIDRFSGEWETTAEGKVTDFNLMLKGCAGDFLFKQLEGERLFGVGHGKNKELGIDRQPRVWFVYCIKGQIGYREEGGNGEALLKENQLMIAEDLDVELKSEMGAKLFYGWIDV